MSASSRRAAVGLLLTLLGRSLQGQSTADTSPPASPRSTIDAAMAVRERGARSLTEVLTSQAPGLLVVPGSGENGMGSRIRLRGVQSLVADRAPLVLVDGMRIEAGEDAFSPSVPQNFPFGNPGPLAPGPLRLDDINPDDVESIEVLPGPASAAIYGPGAQAGVILIHTKRGRSGPPRWEGYVQGGVSAETSNWPANFGGVDSTNPDPRYQHGACSLWNQVNGFCHQDYVQQFNPLEQRSPFRTFLRRQYGLSVSGGSAWGDYRVSGTFAGDAGPPPEAPPELARKAPNPRRVLRVPPGGEPLGRCPGGPEPAGARERLRVLEPGRAGWHRGSFHVAPSVAPNKRRRGRE